jgi:hypothetical protein
MIRAHKGEYGRATRNSPQPTAERSANNEYGPGVLTDDTRTVGIG